MVWSKESVRDPKHGSSYIFLRRRIPGSTHLTLMRGRILSLLADMLPPITTEELAALAHSEGLAPIPANLERVAREVGAELARWAFTQWQLRGRGAAKFARSHEMLFVREALEQATHETLAAWHSSRFCTSGVFDMTCGIGADLIALAARGPAFGAELDPERARYAQHNLHVHDLHAAVHLGDCLLVKSDADCAWCDPARRAEGRRLQRIGEYAPDVARAAEQMRSLRLGGIKLSVMLTDAELRELGGRIEFVNFGRECREAIVWLGADGGSGCHAVHVESGSTLATAAPGPVANDPENSIYEAEPAAIRAHALGTLCEAEGVQEWADSNGFLTGPSGKRSPWWTEFRVLAVTRLDRKEILSTLNKLDARVVAVKPRGLDLDPAQWQKQLKASGQRAVELLVTRRGGRPVCALCERIQDL